MKNPKLIKNPKSKIQDPKFKKLWLWIGVLILLSPLGLLLPKLLKSGRAWGEWGADEIKGITGYVPEGIKRLSKLWSAPFADYTFPGLKGGIKSYMGYVISGVIGAIIVGFLTFAFARVFKRRE